MLVDNTLFGTVDKVQIAIYRIREFEPPEGYYVAFSGGKDSVVVLDLVKRAGVKYDAHYNLTTVDPPELVYFIREHHADVIVHKPKETMWQLIVKNGLPTRQFRWCCKELKETGGIERLVVTGVRHEESANRANRQMVEACRNDPRKRYLNPIIDWTENEVWDYIHGLTLPYCRLYDEGFKRIGCIMCPLANAKQRLASAKRWPRIADAYKRATELLYQRKKARGLSLKPEWNSGNDMYNWWLTDKALAKEIDGQGDFDFRYE